MKYIILGASLIALTACQTTTMPKTDNVSADACGAAQYQNLVGGPSSATRGLPIPGDSRHYGNEERIDPRKVASRLNIVHSGTAIESVIDPNSTVKRVFCG